MALIKREYTDNETIITAKNLNDIQDAVIALEDGLFTVEDDVGGEVITITDASNRGFRGFSIYGKTAQVGTPTPTAPAELINVGHTGGIMVSVAGEKASNEMTIATPNGLPGIPVTSGGNYTDASGQQWIADEIDLARGVYVQRVRMKTFDGTEAWAYDNAKKYFMLSHSVLGSVTASGSMSSHFYRGVSSSSGVFFVGSSGIAFYHVSTNLSGWKAFLAEQLASGTPVKLLYILATPIETPLSAEEMVACASLHTYKDSTTVSNDAGAYMSLEYVMDAKKYIERLVGSSGSGGGAAPARLSSVTLHASKWMGENSLYYQDVTIEGITDYSKVDLLPSVEQLAIFHNKDVAFVTENEDGIVTVYAIGDKPTNDYTMQVSITEVLA